MSNYRLIDGISFEKSNTVNADWEKNSLGEYYYQDVLVEHLMMQDLLDDTYRKNFIDFVVSDKKNYAGSFSLLGTILLIRIEQLQDSNAYYLLTECYKDDNFHMLLIVNETLGYDLPWIFVINKIFFVQQTVKYQDTKLLDSAIVDIRDSLIKEYFFIAYETKVILKKGQLIAYPNIFGGFTKGNIEQKLSDLLITSVYFLSDKYAEENDSYWMQGMVELPNLGKILGDDFRNTLNEQEQDVYDEYIYSVIKNRFIRNYHINNEAGYTDLYLEPNMNSQVLTIIPNDEYVCFLNDYDDTNSEWVKVYYQKTDMKGFIPKKYLIEI